MKALDAKKALQTILLVTPDGQIGPKTKAAFNALSVANDGDEWAPSSAPEIHSGLATSFADPADVAAFRKCKAEGHSDQYCYGVGDSGEGRWGDDCTEGSGPACALPPEDWEPLGSSAHLHKVLVTSHDTGKSVVCLLKDTMPHKANIHNSAIVDLNPDACAALGLQPPLKKFVTWQFQD